MKNMKKNPKQNRESSLMRSPLILGLSMVLCIPVAYSHAKSSNIVNNESVQSILQGRTIKGQIINILPQTIRSFLQSVTTYKTMIPKREEMMTTHRCLNNTYLALISHSKNLY